MTDICKSAYGLAEQQAVAPLTSDDVPAEAAGNAPVSLLSIFHHRGVNALAEDQTLKFGPNLTVVYGDNAAGKSGYIRILKSACRARGQEQILGNVTSGTTPLSPVVSIKYGVGAEEQPREWTGEGDDSSISRVSVFDTQCAAVYLTEKTDVAFRPFGLDLFDKLVKACKSVRAKLEAERNALSADALSTIQVEIPHGTAAAKFLAGISSLTRPETVRAMASLSSEESARLAELEKSLGDLQANDPVKLAQQLDLRAGRVEAFARQLKNIEATLSAGAIAEVFTVRAEGYRRAGKAKRLCEGAFPANMLPGTGAETWTALWEAARQFSQESAYPAQTFPVVDDGAVCVLCQQDLDHAAGHRLKQFEAFVASTTEKELRELRESLSQLKKTFIDVPIVTPAAEDLLNEIRIEHAPLADSIAAALLTNEERRNAVVSALAENRDLVADCPELVSIAHEADALAAQLRSRIKTLRDSATSQMRDAMFSEVLELRARGLLARHQQAILDDIERRKKYAAYGLCLDETKTQTITQKSTAVTKTAVSLKLKQRFKDELAQLGFRHVEVELREAGGSDGVLYHKLALTRAPGVELPKVVSEGEQRCLSIAAFFAELSTADDPSGIVFDDPVSSLDYKYREAVARRLVVESEARQVIVFTHDVVFLLFLKQYAAELNIDQLDQHIRQLSKGAGVCEEELPWVALPVKKKIGHLKNARQAADKLFRDGHQDAYEKDAKHLYGLLREAWERALEEVLLNGIVERYRPSVQTQRLAMISDVTDEDCQALDAAMTKCSRWLPGHDQAAAARAPVPEPNELKDDIDALENWVAAIQKRRR
ncbi:MAG: AAA family ATPase [Bradyrhizobium sp.]|uniref:AAA family ATPase n=1 Tax=Bradyrhizobium sp. TaxID=376 RepID=UPI0025C00D66|nr:AAA family ATPase [Bradyrhizobium sp.]MBI5263869.1 AAA family ATPase [Bradyrhizobium sp.]